jgi:hypothetical protein
MISAPDAVLPETLQKRIGGKRAIIAAIIVFILGAVFATICFATLCMTILVIYAYMI